MTPLESLILMALAPVAEEIRAAVERGEVERAGFVIAELRNKYPLASEAVESIFRGTPAQVVRSLSRYLPGVEKVPGAEEYAARLQRFVWEEWSRPRFARAVKGKELKA